MQASNWDEFIKWYQGNRNKSVSGKICKTVLKAVIDGTIWDGVKWVANWVWKEVEECHESDGSYASITPHEHIHIAEQQKFQTP